jgi:hypothetical protein
LREEFGIGYLRKDAVCIFNQGVEMNILGWLK